MIDCSAKVTVFLQPEGMIHLLEDSYPIVPEERHFQCDRIKDHEGNHETWVPTYGYVRFPNETLGRRS